jgi:acetyl-CoA acetyltransferase
LGARIPVNTHGGLLSQGHIDGMNHITEAVKQLRGDGGPAQVTDAEIAAVSGNGGDLSTHTTLVLRR